MEVPKYRIKEMNGKFTIQVQAYKVTGWLWWEEKELGWFHTDLIGRQCIIDKYVRQLRPSPPFNSLNEAKMQVQEWLNNMKYNAPIYHDCLVSKISDGTNIMYIIL